MINMRSLLVGELKDILENVPEDYEVIMEIRTGFDTKAGTENCNQSQKSSLI